MTKTQAKRLGKFLRDQREALALSTRQLAAQCDLPHTTIIRFEHGAYSAPSPDKLARVAQALDLSLADVYALAKYAVPADLPSPSLYLRTKFPNLPSSELTRLNHDVDALLKRHGIDAKTGLPGPHDGEDEEPEGSRPAKRPAATTGTATSKKENQRSPHAR